MSQSVIQFDTAVNGNVSVPPGWFVDCDPHFCTSWKSPFFPELVAELKFSLKMISMKELKLHFTGFMFICISYSKGCVSHLRCSTKTSLDLLRETHFLFNFICTPQFYNFNLSFSITAISRKI